MSTEAINQANPYGVTMQEVFEGEQLSGEALLFYISSRLNDLDSGIAELMGRQKEVLERKELLNDIRNWVQDYKDFVKKYEGSNFVIDVQPTFREFPMPSKDSPLYEMARELKQEFRAPLSGLPRSERVKTTEAWAEEFTTRLDQISDELDGQSELGMIRLQQMISHRQTAIQLTTNLMAKFNSGNETIVGNLR